MTETPAGLRPAPERPGRGGWREGWIEVGHARVRVARCDCGRATPVPAEPGRYILACDCGNRIGLNVEGDVS
jgi:hypothetical protein